MTTKRPEWPLYALGAVGLLVAMVLILTGHDVPPEVWIFATASVTGGAGVTLNGGAGARLLTVVDELAAAFHTHTHTVAAGDQPPAPTTPPAEPAPASGLLNG